MVKCCFVQGCNTGYALDVIVRRSNYNETTKKKGKNQV